MVPSNFCNILSSKCKLSISSVVQELKPAEAVGKQKHPKKATVMTKRKRRKRRKKRKIKKVLKKAGRKTRKKADLVVSALARQNLSRKKSNMKKKKIE